MTGRISVVVIGAGHAGLSASYHLTGRGIDHVVLEQHDIGHAWRTRWDSFCLVTPNSLLQLPGFHYSGDDPDGFLLRDDIVRYLEGYAESFGAPVQMGVRVTSVEARPDGKGYVVSTDQGVWEADNVIVAAGLFQRPKLPAYSAKISPTVLQMHTSEYRNPGALPAGAVLVVGSGQSGCQIAEEIYKSGRKVYLVAGSAGRVARHYRGTDCFYWLIRVGFFEKTVDKLPSPKAKFAGNPHVSGKDGGHSLNLHCFARDGVTLLGHLQGAEGSKLYLAPGLNEMLGKVDEFSVNLLNMIDNGIRERGYEAPEDPDTRAEESAPAPIHEELPELDLTSAGVNTIIWGTGYAFNYDWVRLPTFDEDGFPVQQRGVSAYPGLYFLGIPWLHTQKSSLFFGVGADADHVVTHLAERA